MSATIVSESVSMTTTETQTVTAKLTAPMELDFVECDCCGLKEECTRAYIDGVRERYQGKWICGLCSEAVKDEMARCERLIGAEEALNRHINFRNKFRSSVPPSNATVSFHLISAMRRILRRSLDSPKSIPTSLANKTAIDDVIRDAGLSISNSCSIPSVPLVGSTEGEPSE